MNLNELLMLIKSHIHLQNFNSKSSFEYIYLQNNPVYTYTIHVTMFTDCYLYGKKAFRLRKLGTSD